jgi:hypothetical protein
VSPRLIAATALIAVFGLVGGLAGGLADGTAAAAATDVPARPAEGSLVGAAVTVASRAFPAGVRFVTATVAARHAIGSSGRPMMLSVTLTCGGESIQATTNVLSTAVLAPRRVMRDATACTVRAQSAVGEPTAADALRVTATIVSAAVGRAAVGYSPDAWPTLMRPGERAGLVPAALAVPAGARSVRVTGDLKVTTCTSVGGSRENGSPYLCAAARVKPAGTRLRVSLLARQTAIDGGYCAVRTLAARTVRVGRGTHHAMVAQSGTVTLSTARGCSRTVRAELHVQVLSGADVVIHRRGTMVSVYR